MASKSREWSPLNELSFRSIEDRSERFRTMEEKRSVDEKETKAFEREERTREKERKRRNVLFFSPLPNSPRLSFDQLSFEERFRSIGSMTRKRFFQFGDTRQCDVSPLYGAQYAYCLSDVRASDSRNVNRRTNTRYATILAVRDNEQRLEISNRTGRGKLKGYCNLTSIVSAPCIVRFIRRNMPLRGYVTWK